MFNLELGDQFFNHGYKALGSVLCPPTDFVAVQPTVKAWHGMEYGPASKSHFKHVVLFHSTLCLTGRENSPSLKGGQGGPEDEAESKKIPPS